MYARGKGDLGGDVKGRQDGARVAQGHLERGKAEQQLRLPSGRQLVGAHDAFCGAGLGQGSSGGRARRPPHATEFS